jgi:hypothetical protein
MYNCLFNFFKIRLRLEATRPFKNKKGDPPFGESLFEIFSPTIRQEWKIPVS